MSYVKLDCGILDSSLWIDRDAREVFITALLMAEPYELTTATPQFEVRELRTTGWVVPPEWYGFVRAAGVGIIRQAGLDQDAGLSALERLGNPESNSRSQDHDGRRLVRVNGGYIVLNYFRFRDHDYTGAERMRRLRARKKAALAGQTVTPSPRHDTAPSDAKASQVTQQLRIAESIKQRSEEEDSDISSQPHTLSLVSDETSPHVNGAKVKKATRKTPFPADFALDDELIAYAAKHLPNVDCAELFEVFRSQALAKGWTNVDWRKALQNYIRHAAPGSGHWAQGQYPKAGGAIQWQ